MAEETFSARWSKTGFEIVGIVFAVLLALWLEGWREDVELQQRVDDHLARIHAEITENRSGVQSSIISHRAFIEGLDAALDGGQIEMKVIAPYLIVEGGSTSDAAWRSAQMSQTIGQMPLATIGTLASLYDTQAYYADYLNFFFQRYVDLTTEIEADPNNHVLIKKFRQHLAITNSLAEQALERYDTFLKSAQ